ncbi:hypothetical protein C4J81_05045 [Deltaproteobacteria bacterium Smac51]|nr:hypothetical protein C4J81_05045 [Deltaproteobacteria bacterium Smac51]
MTVLRRALIDEGPSFDLKGGLGIGLLCLLISAWLHLVFFIGWQHLDGQAVDRFYFHLESEAPAIELTLVMNEPVDEPDESLIMTGADLPMNGVDLSGAGDASEVGAIPAEDAAAEAGDFLTAEELEALAALESFVQSAQELDSGDADPVEVPVDTELNPLASGDGGAVNPDSPLSVEAEAPEFKSYYTAIRRAINKHWVLPPEARNQFRPSRLTCDFTIGRDGTLLRIVIIESSGSATLDHAGLEALRAAAPFPPFTEDLAAFSQLDIRMQFDYQAKYMNRPSK